jgi:RES domain-containing protein
MKMKPNSRYDAFVAELKKLKRHFGRWDGIAFRAAPLEFSRQTKLLDGKGGLQMGGRWLAAGNFRVVNLSTTREAAVKESNASFTYYNFALSDVKPTVIVGVSLKLDKVVDLTNAHGLRSQSWLSSNEMLAEDWRKVNDAGHESQSQAFGRAAHDVGAEGLLVLSARVRRGINLVYFPDSVANPDQIKILGEEELERWLKKR